MTDPAPDGQADLFDQWLSHRGSRTPVERAADPPAAPGRRRRDCPPDSPPLVRPAPHEGGREPSPPARPVTAAHSPAREPEQPDRPATVGEDLAHPTFRPRRTARLVTGLLLLASLAATVLLARQAYAARAGLTTADLVPPAVAAVLTLVLWAVRSSTSVARLSVEAGQLTITRNGETWRCDLAAPATPVEVVGTPGRRGWKVVFARRGRPAYVVDASMVDPVHFTRVLAHYRPDVSGPP